MTIIYEKDTNRPRGFGFATYESSESVDKLCQRKYMKIKVSYVDHVTVT